MAAVSFIVCAAVPLWPLRAFFALRRSLSSAQSVDVHITPKGLFASLPIYMYMRVHVCLTLVATSLIFLISVGAAIITSCSLAIDVLPFFEVTSSLLTLLLTVHIALLAIYESTKPSDRTFGEERIHQILQGLRKGLWCCALSLFASVVLLMLWGLGYAVSQAS